MKTSLLKFPVGFYAVLAAAFLASAAHSVEYKGKSTARTDVPPSPLLSTAPVLPVSHSLEPFYSTSGALALSVNGTGTELAFSTIEIEKPAGARLERAFLIAAAAGGYSYRIDDGRIRVDDHFVIWERTVRNAVGSWNAFADVTDLVRSKVDSAPVGRVLVDIREEESALIDGVILAAVFRIDAGPPDDFVALYFGSQAARRDSIVIGLPEPVPADAFDARFELGLGISYSQQSSLGSEQYTIVDVNGRRLTSSAGGPDDGSPTAGALLTVGGLYDSAGNPADAAALPVNLASDDELYDLRPFISPGESSILVRTQSPASEENLFFAHLFASYGPAYGAATAASGASAVSAAPGESDGVVLYASSAGTMVGSRSEVTATVRQAGRPVRGKSVELRVLAGPHAGAVSQVLTDSTGAAGFAYRGRETGRDLLVALVLDESGAAVAGSNVVSHDWIEEKVDVSLDISPGMCPNVVELGFEEILTVVVVGGGSFDVDDVDVMSLYLEDAAPLKTQFRDVSAPPGDGECACSSEGGDGARDLVLQFRMADVIRDAAAITDGEERALKLSGATKAGKRFEAADCVRFSTTRGRPAELPQDVLTPMATEDRPPSN